MKILHIQTSLSGGAGIAVFRLHEALLSMGIDSRILTYDANSIKFKSVYEFKTKKREASFLNRIIFKGLGIPCTNSQKAQKLVKGKSGVFEIFTSPHTDFDLRNHELVKWCDIIHLHWISDFVDLNSFFHSVKKPLVWTLHDANPFLGGFHLQHDLEKNKKQFDKVESLYRKMKEKVLKNYKNLYITSPSNWLMTESQSSSIFKNKPHYKIFNCIPTHKLQSVGKEISRKALNLEQDDIYLLFISHLLNGYNKGLDIITGVLDNPKLSKRVKFICVGKGEVTHSRVFNFGSVQNINLLSLVYSACDAILIPSRSENMPNVMFEGMCFGLPTLSFEIGGMAEVIKEGVTGLTLHKKIGSSDGLLDIINVFLEKRHSFDKNSIRSVAVSLCSYSAVANQYVRLYKKALNENQHKAKSSSNILVNSVSEIDVIKC